MIRRLPLVDRVHNSTNMIYIGVQKRALHKTSLIFHVKRHYENNAEDTLGSDGKCYNCKQRRFVKNYWWNHPVRFIQLCYGNWVSLNKNFFIKNLTIVSELCFMTSATPGFRIDSLQISGTRRRVEYSTCMYLFMATQFPYNLAKRDFVSIARLR